MSASLLVTALSVGLLEDATRFLLARLRTGFCGASFLALVSGFCISSMTILDLALLVVDVDLAARLRASLASGSSPTFRFFSLALAAL